MQSLRIATWNINSLRLRVGLLDKLVEALLPDVICLQETKVPDPLFPAEALVPLGYPHTVFRGMKGYNGVAILSRMPLELHDAAPDWCGKGDCRHIAADVADARRPGGTAQLLCPRRRRCAGPRRKTRNTATSSISSPRPDCGSPRGPVCNALCWSAT